MAGDVGRARFDPTTMLYLVTADDLDLDDGHAHPLGNSACAGTPAVERRPSGSARQKSEHPPSFWTTPPPPRFSEPVPSGQVMIMPGHGA
jgi:hypothetical protein